MCKSSLVTIPLLLVVLVLLAVMRVSCCNELTLDDYYYQEEQEQQEAHDSVYARVSVDLLSLASIGETLDEFSTRNYGYNKEWVLDLLSEPLFMAEEQYDDGAGDGVVGGSTRLSALMEASLEFYSEMEREALRYPEVLDELEIVCVGDVPEGQDQQQQQQSCEQQALELVSAELSKLKGKLMQEMQETCHPLEEIVMVGGCSSENHGTEYVCNLYSRENLEWRVDLGQEYKRYLQGVKDGLLRGRVYMEKVIEARNKSKMHRQQIQEMEKERALLYHEPEPMPLHLRQQQEYEQHQKKLREQQQQQQGFMYGLSIKEWWNRLW